MIEWFTLKAAGFGLFDEMGHVALGGEQGRTLAVFEAPDVVRLPADVPEHGGRVLKVLGTKIRRCPTCDRAVVHWLLEDRFALACCRDACGFVSYREAIRAT